MFLEGITSERPAKEMIEIFLKEPSYHILQEQIRPMLKTSSMKWVEDFINYGGLMTLTSSLSRTNLLGK